MLHQTVLESLDLKADPTPIYVTVNLSPYPITSFLEK